jgi:hypothetical protein
MPSAAPIRAKPSTINPIKSRKPGPRRKPGDNMTLDRTFAPLELSDLRNLCPRAAEETRRFYDHVAFGKYSRYHDRLLAVVVVQGAAQHFVDTRPELKADHHIEVDRKTIEEKGQIVTDDGRVISGVKDLDIAILFDAIPDVPIPPRNHCLKAVWVTLPGLGERKLDLMKKSVVTIGAKDSAGIVRSYLQNTPHGTKFLSKKSVLGLYPEPIFGQPLWVSRRWAGGKI